MCKDKRETWKVDHIDLLDKHNLQGSTCWMRAKKAKRNYAREAIDHPQMASYIVTKSTQGARNVQPIPFVLEDLK